MHQYVYIEIYILRAFQILKYLVALIFIRVHSPLFFGHFSTATFSHWVSRSWSQHQKLCEELRLVSPNYYHFRCIVDLVVLLVYYSVCVDKSGSLSGSAFNQLRLVTLSIVLTILYLLKTVLQRSLLQCLNSLYKSDEAS